MATLGSREVVFADAQEVASYVEREIGQAIPAGWWFRRDEYGPRHPGARAILVWRIFPAGLKPNERQTARDFILVVSSDFEMFIVYHGNNDAGALSLYQMLMKAVVMEREALHMFPLSSVIKHVVEHCKPNQWFMT